MDAFDADVLIYAAIRDHPLGRRVRARLGKSRSEAPAGIGSMLLLPGLLAEPVRTGATDEVDILAALLSRLDLRPLDHLVARVATSLGAKYRLRAVDAVHLATAVTTGCDRFITNNHKDFPKRITEVAVTYPGDLPEP